MNSFNLILIVMASIGLTACSEVGFETRKSEFLNKVSVMGEGSSDRSIGSDLASGTISQHGEGDSNQANDSNDSLDSPINLGGTAGDITQPPYLGFPGGQSAMVSRHCTDRAFGANIATTFKAASAARGGTMSVTINNKPCTTELNTIVNLARQDSISIADLRAICPASVPTRGGLIVGFNWPGMPSEVQKLSSSIDLLWARNNQGIPSEAPDQYCTIRYSPLVIHVGENRSNPAPISLTSIVDGIAFDLLGARNGHRKVQIGWFTNQDYAFLALPDEDGHVRGIDQLFGDNTQFHDGTFSDNGYAALAKYDGTSSDGRFQLAPSDGRIDRQDAVYSRLRLWKDRNLDGVAEASELIPLEEADIEFIDLAYSEDYLETDKYGNQTKMKSVVGLTDGSLDLIFDLWFVYQKLDRRGLASQ